MSYNRVKLRHATRLRFSPQVFAVGAILSVTFFLLSIDAFKTYASSITISVNVKSDAVGRQERLVSDILEFPRTLAFYDRLLKYNPDVRDVAAGKSLDRRREMWNDMLSIGRSDEDPSAVTVSIEARLESDADLLAQKTVREISDVVAAYYDISKDVDLRVIGGPVSRGEFASWYWAAPLSALLGFLIALLLQSLLPESRRTPAGKNASPEAKDVFGFKKSGAEQSDKGIKALEDIYMAEQAGIPVEENYSAIREMKQLTKEMEPDRYPNFREVPKAAAPDNLPIADDTFFAQPGPAKKEKIVEEAPATKPAEEKKTETEPTPEQLKERLNKLLRGEL